MVRIISSALIINNNNYKNEFLNIGIFIQNLILNFVVCQKIYLNYNNNKLKFVLYFDENKLKFPKVTAVV